MCYIVECVKSSCLEKLQLLVINLHSVAATCNVRGLAYQVILKGAKHIYKYSEMSNFGPWLCDWVCKSKRNLQLIATNK